MYDKSMMKTQNLGPYDGNLYYFENGWTVQARDMQDAFKAFRIEHGATPAILADVRTMVSVWDEAAARSQNLGKTD